jgi:signal transduction histidine kinase/CheY-like chemotaxis protein
MVSFQLVSIFTRLQSPSTRLEGAAELAQLTGAEQVLLFGKDHQIDVYLPAPGMPQTLRGGARWQRFLNQCRQQGGAIGKLPAPAGDSEITADAMIAPDGAAIIVFIDGAPSATERAERELVFRREAEQNLRDADRRKDEFLAMLAHELRNPLAPISMAAQILKLGTVSQQRLQQTSQIIDRQVSHMTSLLDDLLDVSRVTGGRVTLAQDMHDMRAIVRDALEQARPAIIARHHHLTITLATEAVHVCGDGTRLVQIITNLLNNAGKYTPQGGQISLTLEVAGDHVDVLVRDNGIGISADLLPHVFDLFTQGERSPDRAQGGLGLGLALAKSLVERHGGTLSAASAGASQGSLFTVRLPRAKGVVVGDDSPCESHTLDDPHTGLNVLIVDDNADAAHTLSLFLEAVGHKVRVALDGIGALKSVGERAPQVLLLDIGLPDIDGHDLARSLRALPQTARAIFIALTGYGAPEDRERSREAGFDYHLTKPVNPTELARVLTELKQAQAQAQAA